MEWTNLYGADRQPTESEIAAYVASPLWAELHDFLRESYHITPTIQYSGCSGQPGWNVRYQKSGRSLCTLYPMDGFFIVLVVIGAREQAEAALLKPSCSEHVQALFESAGGISGARWLMIQVTTEEILADVKRLIQLRRKIT